MSDDLLKLNVVHNTVFMLSDMRNSNIKLFHKKGIYKIVLEAIYKKKNPISLFATYLSPFLSPKNIVRAFGHCRSFSSACGLWVRVQTDPSNQL